MTQKLRIYIVRLIFARNNKMNKMFSFSAIIARLCRISSFWNFLFYYQFKRYI